jgi:hypothetical protein
MAVTLMPYNLKKQGLGITFKEGGLALCFTQVSSASLSTMLCPKRTGVFRVVPHKNRPRSERKLQKVAVGETLTATI